MFATSVSGMGYCIQPKSVTSGHRRSFAKSEWATPLQQFK